MTPTANTEPKEIHYLDILGFEWSVFWFTREIPGYGDTWGICEKDKRYIAIRYSQDSFSTLDTLFHEIVHAIFHEMQMCETETEEQVAGKLGKGIAWVLIKNPALRDFVAECDP